MSSIIIIIIIRRNGMAPKDDLYEEQYMGARKYKIYFECWIEDEK